MILFFLLLVPLWLLALIAGLVLLIVKSTRRAGAALFCGSLLAFVLSLLGWAASSMVANAMFVRAGENAFVLSAFGSLLGPGLGGGLGLLLGALLGMRLTRQKPAVAGAA